MPRVPASGVRHGHDDVPLRLAGVGDPGLRAVQDVAAPVPDGPRLLVRGVRARLRLGQRVGARAPRPDASSRRIVGLLALAAELPDRVAHDGVVDRDDHGRRRADARELLDGEDVGERVGPGAAVLLRDHHPEDAHPGEARQDLARKRARLLALRHSRRDLGARRIRARRRGSVSDPRSARSSRPRRSAAPGFAGPEAPGLPPPPGPRPPRRRRRNRRRRLPPVPGAPSPAAPAPPAGIRGRRRPPDALRPAAPAGGCGPRTRVWGPPTGLGPADAGLGPPTEVSGPPTGARRRRLPEPVPRDAAPGRARLPVLPRVLRAGGGVRRLPAAARACRPSPPRGGGTSRRSRPARRVPSGNRRSLRAEPPPDRP